MTDVLYRGDWNAEEYFADLVARNRLARELNFAYGACSGLDGFEDGLHNMQRSQNIILLGDTSDGYVQLEGSPITRRVKTVFMAMRHAPENMEARQRCLSTMRELHRQLITALLRDRAKLAEQLAFVEPRIAFNEVDRYFFSGAACAFFHIAVDVHTDLTFNPDQWL